ncbi:hypothetical protein BV378_20675 [Nostoc sp. RF31YmG]|jgi:hypothetical protein|nr:hypothetical protein BV378_20675 [Nostoc sp. RF31YmG]
METPDETIDNPTIDEIEAMPSGIEKQKYISNKIADLKLKYPDIDSVVFKSLMEMNHAIDSSDYSELTGEYVREIIRENAFLRISYESELRVLNHYAKQNTQLHNQMSEFNIVDFGFLKRFLYLQLQLKRRSKGFIFNVKDDEIQIETEASRRRGKPAIIKRFSNALDLPQNLIQDIFASANNEVYERLAHFSYIWTGICGKRSGNTFTIYLSEEMT